MGRSLAVGAAGSLLLHAAVVLTGAYSDGQWRPPPPEPIAIEIVPPPPPPPEPPLAAPEPPPPPPKPRPRPRPRPAAVVTDAGIPEADAGPVDDGGVDAGDAGDAGPPVDAGVADAAAVAQGATDPATLDLRPYVPPGAQVMVVLRPDRMRGSPLAARVESVLAPMPDYRFVFAPLARRTGATLVDAFPALVIATPEPRDISATFLAVRSDVPDDILRRSLGDVDWTEGPDGAVGTRRDAFSQRIKDPRVFHLARPGWALLVRPEHVAGGAWRDRLWSIEALTGDATGPIALLVVADTGQKQLTLPGIPPIPVPARLSIAVTPATGGGLVVAGAAELPDPAAAAAFATALGDAQRQIAASLTTRLLLRQLRALGVVERLRVKQTDRFVTFSSSLTAGEADALLEQAATASHNYFTGRAR